jgi:uncharacterized protein (TIGR02284 family)
MADIDISTLNSLIKTTIDSINGFEHSAEHSENGRFTSLFREFAEDRRQVVARLQQEVRGLGGEAETDGSVAGAAHRTFIDLKDAVVSRDDKAVIEEVERGEDYLKEKYETALTDDSLSPPVRAAIEQAYQSVRAGHDKASQLKHSFANG